MTVQKKRLQLIMTTERNLEKLPIITDKLNRLLDQSVEDTPTRFIITYCGKGGYVYGNHMIDYEYDKEEIISRLERVANGKGKVVHGTVRLEKGKIAPPVSVDALVSFGTNEPIFPIGHYIEMMRSPRE